MTRRNERRKSEKLFPKKIKDGFGKIGTLNIVLICVGVYMVFINWQMLKVFQIYGSAPETAWCALIAALLGECGICGWIKTSKEKHRNRSRDEPAGKDSNLDIEEIQINPEDAKESETENEMEDGKG